jgi:hypothetical protein
MDFVAYNYFRTPSEAELKVIADLIWESLLQVSHAGKSDPPKKFSGAKEQFSNLVLQRSGITNYTFIKDKRNSLEASLEVRTDPAWPHSTFSVSGPDKHLVQSTCLGLSRAAESFMCISSQLGAPKPVGWELLHKSGNCPEFLVARVQNA